MESTTDFKMDVGSSSGHTALVAAPQTVSKRVGAPYRKRAKNAVLNDATLEQVMGSKEKALDAEEFPEASPFGLDGEDRDHWARICRALFDPEMVDKATKHTNPRSFGSHLAHARQTLRMLQDVSGGIREKFEISGCQPKKVSQGSKNKVTKTKANGTAKPKRAKSTNPRDNKPSQHDTNLAMASSSIAGQDDATDAMDYTPADAVLESVEDDVFETPELRAENDRAMRQMGVEIREAHPVLRDISPDTMIRTAHLVDMGLWFRV